MDRPLEPVNRSAWDKNLDRVHKLQASTPGKNDKFTKALDEEMEEEKKRQHEDEDAVILSRDAGEDQDRPETDDTPSHNADRQDEQSTPTSDDTATEPDEQPPHIDVKA